MFRSLSLPVALGAISAMAGEPCDEKQSPAFASPQEVWNAYRYARHERRWTDAFRCVTPEAQQRSIGSIVFAAVYLQKTPAKGTAAKLKTILANYGLDLEEMEAKAEDSSNLDYLERLIRSVKDKERLFQEAMTVLHRAKRRPKDKDEKPVIALGELKSIQVAGDRARGKCMKRLDDRETFDVGGVRQTQIEVEVEFRKIGGRWFVDGRGY